MNAPPPAATAAPSASRAIELRGVRVHNLQNIDADIPLKKLIVVTGVSGPGKSSLAFDTLYAAHVSTAELVLHGAYSDYSHRTYDA